METDLFKVILSLSRIIIVVCDIYLSIYWNVFINTIYMIRLRCGIFEKL